MIIFQKYLWITKKTLKALVQQQIKPQSRGYFFYYSSLVFAIIFFLTSVIPVVKLNIRFNSVTFISLTKFSISSKYISLIIIHIPFYLILSTNKFIIIRVLVYICDKTLLFIPKYTVCHLNWDML